MAGFRRIFYWQIAIYGITGWILGAMMFRDGELLYSRIAMSEATLIVLGVLVIAITHFLGNVLHELQEINDQLAGRSTEFKDLVQGSDVERRSEGSRPPPAT